MTATLPTTEVHLVRAASAERFRALGWPSPRLEAWRYFSTKSLQGFAIERPLERATLSRDALGPALSPCRVVLANGRFVPALSDLGPFAACLHQVSDAAATLQLVPATEAFEAANLAFQPDGATLQLALPAGFRAGVPLEVLHVADAEAEVGAEAEPGTGNGHLTGTIHARLLVTLGEGAALTLIQHWVGQSASFVNAVLEATLATGAVLHHTKLCAEAAPAQHVDAIHVAVGRDARFHGFVLAHGTGRARTSERVVLAAPGATCEVHGLYLGEADARLDHFTEVVHAAPHTRSRERWHGAMDGRSEGTFQGLVRINAGAFQSDTHQLTKSLLLSPDAQANAKPELHIDCDDVKAAHGATVGQLDPKQLFYLAQRGIGPEEARRLLLGAFILESLATAPLAAQPALTQALGARIAASRELDVEPAHGDA